MTALPALVYESESAALADVDVINEALGFPNPGGDTWAVPMQRWDGKWWIVDPIYNGKVVAGLLGSQEPDANAWPEVP